MEVHKGGVACNVDIAGGCRLAVSSGGKLTGSMWFDDGATYYIAAGAIFDFDISEFSPGDDILVNDLSWVYSKPFTYTLTVSDTQAAGVYRLALDAYDFGKNTITVKDTTGEDLGTLAVNGDEVIVHQLDLEL